MKRYSRHSSIRVLELFVRASLSYLNKSELEQDANHLTRLKNRNVAHCSSQGNLLDTYKFSFHEWLAFFQKHLYYLFQVGL